MQADECYDDVDELKSAPPPLPPSAGSVTVTFSSHVNVSSSTFMVLNTTGRQKWTCDAEPCTCFYILDTHTRNYFSLSLSLTLG